jgi:hypothetical protein
MLIVPLDWCASPSRMTNTKNSVAIASILVEDQEEASSPSRVTRTSFYIMSLSYALPLNCSLPF